MTLVSLCSASQTRTTCAASNKPVARPSGLVRRVLRPPPAPAAQTEAPPPKERQAEAPAPPPSTSGSRSLVSQSLDDLGVLASRLLMNAASFRAVRGETHCLHCRGTGRVTCSACQGAGIVQREPVRMNQVKHAVGKVQVLLGMNDAKMFDNDWMKSNRCKRCHGSGALPCVQCDGTGRRG
ncbi:hypothetical protein ABPG77_000186 [Micractinium sp. CCAP 211/92]